jgi:hypothetical protein
MRPSRRTPHSSTPPPPACSARRMDLAIAHAALAARLRRARRAQRSRRSLARSGTRTSRCDHATSTCPCQGPCRQRAPHRRPPCHSAASSSAPASSSASTSLHSSKQQTDAKLKAHVAIVCFKYFRCFTCMLQVLYRCCKSRSARCTGCNDYTRMFQVYVLNVSSIPDECCKGFVWMLYSLRF